MKKFLVFFALMAAVTLTVFCVSCANKKVSVLDDVTKVSLIQNPATAGSVMAKGCYMGYLILKADPQKYDKELKTLEALYAELMKAKQADENPKIGDINKAALTVLRAAATAKYGYVKGGLIADATDMAGKIIDLRIKKKMGEIDENAFMDAFTTTLQECVVNSPVLEKELEEECVNCDIVERIKAELANGSLTAEERAEYEAMLKMYESGESGSNPTFCGESQQKE